QREVAGVVEVEVVPGDVQVPAAGAGGDRFLVGESESDVRRQRNGCRASPRLAAVRRLRDTNQEQTRGAFDGQCGEVHVAGAVRGQPGVADVDVAAKVGQRSAVSEGLAAVGRVGVAGQVVTGDVEQQASSRVV